jgi:hypothetical protein
MTISFYFCSILLRATPPDANFRPFRMVVILSSFGLSKTHSTSMDLIFQIMRLFYCLYVYLCRNTSMKTFKVALKNRINRFSTALVIVDDFRDDRTILDNTVPFIQKDALFLFRLPLKRVACMVFRS